jgi:hypothetical protein
MDTDGCPEVSGPTREMHFRPPEDFSTLIRYWRFPVSV